MQIAIKFTNGIGATTNTFAAFDDTCEVTVTGIAETEFYVILSKCGGVALCNAALAVDGVATLNLNTDRIRSLFADGRCDSKGLVTVYSTTNHVLGVAAVLISYAADPITGTIVVGVEYAPLSSVSVLVWDTAETYAINQLVGYQGTIYKSLSADNQGNTPGSSPLSWESTTNPPGSGVLSVNGDFGPNVLLGADDIEASETRLWLTPMQAATIAATSGTNTGDQDISGIATNSEAIENLDADDIADGIDTHLITTAQQTVLNNTSGTNTGDQTLPTKTSDLTNDSVLGDITAGTNITIDKTDPRNPTISAADGSGSTDLSEGTATETTVDVNSSSGNNATLQPASTIRAGVMSKAKFDEVEANNAKETNVSTNLSEGTATETTVDINSSDGDNATLQPASTLRAGVMSKAKYDEIVANTSARHAAATVVDSATIDMSVTGQEITASVIDASIGTTQLSIGVNTSLGKADSALQSETDPLSLHLDQTTPQSIINGQPIQGTLTASELVATDASKKLQSLAVSTYPSLAELAYVKGVTSALQTQLNAGLVEVVSSLPGSPTANKVYILTADDSTAKAAPGEYVHDGTGWACSACWGIYDLGNITGSISTTVIPGVRYEATQTGAVTAWAITFTRPGGCDFTIAGEFALATPTMTSRTSKLFGGSTAWDDASTALKTISIEDDETYLLLIASEIVAVS